MRLPITAVAFSGICLALASQPSGPSPHFRKLTIPTGNGAHFIAVADINQDGKPDIIVANGEAGSVTVLLSDGKGHFSPAAGSPIPSGPQPNDIAVADMNHDGHPDLVIANHQSPYITVLLGDGKGGFHPAPGSPFDVHSYPHPHGVAVGEFSGSGNLDVVTDSWGNNQIELLHGDGKGGLLIPGRFFPVGKRPYERLRSADFNKDGHPDIVTTNLDGDNVTILLGDGKGGFVQAAGSPFPAGGKPWQVAIGDLNGDGNVDLAIIPYERDLTDPRQAVVTVLLGNGRGGFSPLQNSSLPLEGCHGSNSIAIGDIDGDGHQDIAVSCAESANVALFFGRPGGNFTRSMQSTDGGWGSIAVADLNGDGRADLIVANPDAGSITIYYNE